MKQFLSLILCATVLLVISPFSASSAGATISGVCGQNLSWSFVNGTLTIGGTGDSYDYGYAIWGALISPLAVIII